MYMKIEQGDIMIKNNKYLILFKVLCYSFLLAALISCGNKEMSQERSKLRTQAEAFGELLINIQYMDEYDAKEKLDEFIEPSANLKEKIDQYYDDFSAASEKASIVSQSIIKINIHSDLIYAEVTYNTVAELKSGREFSAKQITKWKRIGEKWYRTVKEPVQTLDNEYE